MNKPQNYPQAPKHLWEHFFQLTQIPRPSKKEGKVRQYLLDLANEHGCEAKLDDAENVVIYVPATPGREKCPSVIIQNHMDMVTDAEPGKKINFETDPIEIWVDNGLVKARGTTLGADNGIGLAAAVALMTNPDISHPALELLFTSDEETGLHGAWGVKGEMFKSKVMLNLDTEEWGSIYVGCAGGADYHLSSQEKAEKIPSGLSAVQITLGGLAGGHSGIDIHKGLGNANKILALLLEEIAGDFALIEFVGGKAHNIIPRDAWAIVAVSESDLSLLEGKLKSKIEKIKSYLPPQDKNLFVKLEKKSFKDMTGKWGASAREFLNLIHFFPHGAHSYWRDFDPMLVGFSNNLARVEYKEGRTFIETSYRFFEKSQMIEADTILGAVARMFSLRLELVSSYPSWRPNLENPLRSRLEESYQRLFAQKPQVLAIHAGLECGIISEKIPGVSAISFGPTIRGAHSPQESVEVASVEKFWILLTDILKTSF